MSTSDAHPPLTWGKRLAGLILWGLLATVFGLCGWYFMLKSVTVATGNWLLARDYQSVPGEVVPHTGQDADGSFTWYGVRYTAGGRTFETSRLSVLNDEAIDEPYNATVFKRLEEAKSAGQPVSVWVSPRLPEAAVVSRELPLGRLWLKALLGSAFAIFALAGVAGVVGAGTAMSFYHRLVDAAPMWAFAAAWCGFMFPITLLLAGQDSVEWVPMIFVGVFDLIGLIPLWSAIHTTAYGNAGGGNVLRPGRSKLKGAALATSYGSGKNKRQAAQAGVKRGGMGGRGDDFDKS